MKQPLCCWVALCALGAVQAQTPPSGSRGSALFQSADRNGDGTITRDETDRPRLFDRLDRDGDGRITAEEAAGVVRARQAGRAGASAADGFVVHSDLRYARIPGVDPGLLSLDIYTPKERSADPAPVVIMVHGGGWRAGDKANAATGPEKAAFFTAQGYVFVSVNYRLSPAVRHPAHAEDVARAVAWVAEQIGRYGGDPGRITLMGHSAGAHLAALVAVHPTLLRKAGARPGVIKNVILLDTAGYDITRNMTELGGGPINRAIYENAFGTDRKVWIDGSPLTHVGSADSLPRFLIFHVDRTSSATLSRAFAAALRKAGATAQSVLARGKSHATLNQDIGDAGDGPSRLILEFLAGQNTFPDAI